MKKVLLATSALVMFAGAASAEIALSGNARMGLVYSDAAGGSSTTQFSSRVRVIFTMSGETDGGLAFGASVRHDQDDAPGDGLTNGDNTVFISGAFGKLTMGDVSGAVDSLVGQTSGVGFGPNDALQELAIIGSDKTAIYYEYSTGPVTFGVGIGQLDTGTDTYNVAVAYSDGGYSAAIGWETDSTEDLISLSGSATFGAATVKARVADTNLAGVDTTWSLSVDYVTGPTTITGFYTDLGNTAYGVGDDTQHIGLGVAYDLGGGATLAAGVVSQQNDVATDLTFADVGLKFKF